jgi:outer membrane protein assembly factor BamD
MMTRAEDAQRRLAALHQQVPTPTQAAIAQNRKEEDSRRSSGMFGHLMGNFSRHPDVAQATKVGDPTLVDPKPVSATDVVAAANRAVFSPAGKTSDNKVAVETVKGGAPLPNEAAPRSDTPPATGPDTTSAPANTTPATTEVETVPAANDSAPAPAATGNTGNAADANGIGELKPNVAPDSQPPPPPAQVNEIQQNSQQGDSSTAAASSSTSSSSADKASSNDNSQTSSSKKKKKKHKLFF